MMERRILGSRGLEVAALGFGAIKLPRVDIVEAARALNRALDLGLNLVDTARNYGDSERKIGNALRHRRAEYLLATKSSARDARGLRADLETSLRELQTDYIDLYQLHSVSDAQTWQRVMAPDGAFAAAVEARSQGLVRHVGITMHRALGEMRQAIESGHFATIMVAYSILDPEGVGAEVVPLAHQRGLGVIAMKPLGGGTLTTPAHARRAHQGDPVVAGCLRFVLSQPAVSVVIPGMESTAQVEENFAAIEQAAGLSEAERRELMTLLGGLRASHRYGQACLRCGYCQPCPQGIAIPEVLRAMHMAREYPKELRHLGRELYLSLEVSASACVQCEQCPSAFSDAELVQAGR